MKNITLLEPVVTVKSSLKEDSKAQLDALKGRHCGVFEGISHLYHTQKKDTQEIGCPFVLLDTGGNSAR